MKTFQCTKCGCTLAQPTEPFRCPQCGSQGIGLFRALGDSGNGAYGMPQQGGFRPQQPGMNGGFSGQGGYGAPQGGFQQNSYQPQGGNFQQGSMNGGFQQQGTFGQQGGMNAGFQRPNPSAPYGGAMPGNGAMPGRMGGMPGGAVPGGAMPGRMGGMPGNAMPGGTMNRMGGGFQQNGFGSPMGGNPSMSGQMSGNFQRPGFGTAPQGMGNAYPQQGGNFGPQGINAQMPQSQQPGFQHQGMNAQMPQSQQPGFQQQGMNPQMPQNQQPGFQQQGMNPQMPQSQQPGFQHQGMNAQMPQSQQSGFQQQGMNTQMPQSQPMQQPQQVSPQGMAPMQDMNAGMAGASAETAGQTFPQQNVSAVPQNTAPQAPASAPVQAPVPESNVPSAQPQPPVQQNISPQTPAQPPVSAAETAPAPHPVSAPGQPAAQKPALKPGMKPIPRPAGTAPAAPQRPAGTPVQRPAGPPAAPRPTAAPQKRPMAQVQQRPVQRPAAPAEQKPAAAPEQRGIRVRQVPQRPAAGAQAERPRYRAPEPRPQIRPEIDRPERCFWGFPEQPPFTCDARPMRNAPVVDEKGRLVLVSQGKLFCLDITRPEPEVVWEYMIQSHVPGPIVVDQHGDYHLHAMDGYLHMVTKDGKQSYRPVQVGEPLGYAAPIVDGWGNTLISGYNGGLIRVNAQGQKDAKPYFRTRAKLDSSGVIAGSVLYIGSEDGYLFAIDLDDAGGRLLWDQSKEVGYAGGFLNSSPAIGADGIIVVATRAEKLLGFHSTGEVAWTAYMPGQLLGSPVIDANGNIYVGASMSTRQGNRGYLVCVDGVSHKIRWQFETDDMIESTPCIGNDGTIYFGDNSGWLYALNSHGDKKWSAKFEAGIRSAGTIAAPKLLTFALDDDVLVAVRCDSEELNEAGWPKLGHDNFHSFLGPVAPPKPLSEDAPE